MTVPFGAIQRAIASAELPMFQVGGAEFDPTMGMGLMGRTAPRLAKGILAYHGTPHDVDRFSLSKIGSGEGGQAYGWGLYFAEARKAAEHYRTALTAALRSKAKIPARPDIIVRAPSGSEAPLRQLLQRQAEPSPSFLSQQNDPAFRRLLEYTQKQLEPYRMTVQDALSKPIPYDPPTFSQLSRGQRQRPRADKVNGLVALLRDAATVAPAMEAQGFSPSQTLVATRVYNAAHNAAALAQHGDDPLLTRKMMMGEFESLAHAPAGVWASVPRDVREAMVREGKGLMHRLRFQKPDVYPMGNTYAVRIDAPKSAFLDLEGNPFADPRVRELMAGHRPEAAADDYVEAMGRYFEGAAGAGGPMSSRERYRSLVDAFKPFHRGATPLNQFASEMLRDAGAPGFKYLDAASRGERGATHNFVVFDDRLIDILGKLPHPKAPILR